VTDYNVYKMNIKERFMYTLIAASFIYIIGYIFYHSHILAGLISLFGVFYPKMKTKDIIRNRKNNLNLQFSDMIYSLSSSLGAGQSIESAFNDVLKDLSIQYPDPTIDIMVEIEEIIRKLQLNETVESALQDFAQRSHLEDVQNFVDVFKTCKRTGGNLVDIIRNTSTIIHDKINIKMEIDTMISAKKFEQKVLSMIPIFLMIMLSMSAKDYMEPVFTTVLGRIGTTVSIILLGISTIISSKIMKIEV